MTKRTNLFVLVLLCISLLITGCVDKKKIDEIAETQKEMLATLKSIEGKIGNLPKAAAQPSRPTIDYNKVYNLPIGTSPIKGNKKAPVTIVEFSDFQCPYCARLQPTLKQVLEAYPNDVKLVFKDFPLSFHKQAKNAAKAARAAGEQGKYWEMHDLIFEKFSTVNEAMMKEFAEKLNLDMNKFQADFNSTKYDNLIEQDINLGRTAGVTGTPSLFLNGKRMQRRSFEDFKAAIDEILKKK
ncbi:MAG: DsbA family protein [Nitrospiraceae bacterium]|nr:MAG: DsbA family protein [Nitrospiraceae bacterium]